MANTPLRAESAHVITPNRDFTQALADYNAAQSVFMRAMSDPDLSIAGDQVDAAFLALLHAPSRDAADIATKIDALIVEYEDSMMDEDRLRLIAADARRLASGEA